jgi:creatinine amidohydrolase
MSALRPRRWSELAWPELRQLAAGEVGLVPVGATEQHGPHLPTGTDTIIATAICEAVSTTTQAPVLPAIAIGCSYGHGTKWPGTFSLTPTQLAETVVDMATWAAESGLRRLLFVNAHFGNDAALRSGTDILRFRRPDLRSAVVNWWTLDPVLTAEMTADGDDVHANRAETSLMLAIAPHLVRVDQMCDADDPDRTGDLVFRYTAPDLSTNGVTGRPSEASVGLGSDLFRRACGALEPLVQRARLESAPLRLRAGRTQGKARPVFEA